MFLGSPFMRSMRGSLFGRADIWLTSSLVRGLSIDFLRGDTLGDLATSIVWVLLEEFQLGGRHMVWHPEAKRTGKKGPNTSTNHWQDSKWIARLQTS